MSAEVEKASCIESRSAKMSGATVTSAAPMGSQKVSMFAAKTGFVIPKNKLSGSLVPIFRVNKKLGGNESANGENVKQTQRNTKWGPDLTQDTAVRKGRLIAYQTRLEQIRVLLKSGTLEVPKTQVSEAENVDDNSPGPQGNNKNIQALNNELLELEKREVIGEILKLNPSYKAPPDYRPLLKEDSLPLPVKEYPGYNFIGLIYGPSGENQKRLEKETGAKIRICGIKAGTGEKDEIKPTDVHETQNAYEELYVCMSADTFDKIDAAISVIELLITSISGNLATGSTLSDLVSTEESSSSRAEGTTVSNMGQTPVPNQGVMHQLQVYAPTPMQGQFRYPSAWPSHNLPPAPAFISPQDPPSSFSRPPAPVAFNPAFRGPPVPPPRQQFPAQDLQQPFMTQTSHVGQPRVNALTVQRPSLVPSNVSNPNFTGSGQLPSGPLPNMPGSSIPSALPQLVPGSIPPGPRPDRPLAPSIVSTGFSGPAVGSSASMGPNNMGQMALSIAPPFLPRAAPPHGVNSSGTASANAAVANVDGYASFTSGPPTPQAMSIHKNHPITPPIPSPQMGHRPLFAAHNPAGNFIAGSASTPPTPPTNTSNFTFQPRGPQNPSPHTILNLNIQNTPTVPTLQQPASGAPSFHPAAPNFMRAANQPFPGPQAGSQIGNHQIQEVASNPIGMQVSARIPAFLDQGPRTQLHQGNFSPAMQMQMQMPNLPRNFTHRPGNAMQLEQCFPMRAPRPEVRFTPPRYSSNLAFVSGRPPPISGGQQVYDPFSPTSVAGTQQQGSNPPR
ncbi:splicing factor 1-like isoform X1 [Cucurbita moschata]|uniref:Splicing factor 1-like isoform X1 n=1 Tax=Cucurbita moschata TaxID=3662 RepID=A0A6J1FUX8_CUCMO|nr:splicing factor 1-like isoform X1 [Cucurbita moschata]